MEINDNNINEVLNERHQQNKADAVKVAKDLAAADHPATKEEVRMHVQDIRAKYQGLVGLVNAYLKPKSHRAAGQVDTQLAVQETTELDRHIAEKKHQLGVHRLDNPEVRGAITVPLKAVLVLVITLIAFTSESLWLSGAFVATGQSQTRATWIGLGVTLIMAALAHATVYAIRKLKRKAWKIAAGAVSLAIAGTTYYVLGLLRAKYLNEILEHTGGLATQPWMFLAISLGTYIAIGLFSLLLFPSLDEIEAYRDRRKAKRELRKRVAELAALEAERKAMPRQFAQSLEERARVVETADALKLHICELHRETHFAFVQTNVMRRRSAPPPELFDEPPTLDFDDHRTQAA